MSLVACIPLLHACGSKTSPPAATSSVTSSPAAPAMPAPAVTQATWAPDALEKLVAPIALYPDQLVGQILAASVNAQEVLDGGNWLLQNENLKGDALDSAAQKAGLGPAMRALVQFPTIVDMMCQQMDWTRQLGSAFTSDQKGVLDAVQRLRAQAAQVGNLKSTPQQTVTTKTEDQKTVIEVKPADPQIVYVPQYNPQVVYTTPPPPAPAAPAPSSGTVSTSAAVVGGLLAFGVGIAVGSAIHNDDYCYPHWGAGAVYVGPRPFYPPAYVYRPVYGPGFRPAYGYAPPPNYRYGYRSTNVNGNVNINVNNNNYFNQFNNNQNFRNVTNNNISGATRNTVNDNWKGQSTYAGGHNGAQTQRLNQTAGQAPGAAYPGTSQAYNATARVGGGGGTRNPAVGGSGATRNPGAANSRPASTNLGGVSSGASSLGANRNSGVDRGYGSSSREGNVGALGAGGPAADATRPAQSADSLGQRQGAFSGSNSSGGGSFAQASSARGHASVGNRSAGGHGRLAR